MQLTANHYTLLGKILSLKQPELAKCYLKDHPPVIPSSMEYENIEQYFLQFCKLKGLRPEDYRGAIFRRNKSETRKLFISAIMRLFIPLAYSHPAELLRLPNGFLKALSHVLKRDQPYVSNWIREVITLEKVYEAYREEVEQLVIQMREVESGGA